MLSGGVPALKPNEIKLKMEAMQSKASNLLADNYVDTHGAWVEGHLKLLCELRSVVGNDLDKIIIMGVIGQRMFQSSKFTDKNYDKVSVGDYQVDVSRLTNVESISVSTGIPRESVRRKVAELVDAGWIQRSETGKLQVLQQAANELEKCTAIERNFISVTIARILTFVDLNT
jgi:hypothetical protein